MPSSATTTVGNVVVVTHVLPIPEHGVLPEGVGNEKFNRVRPVALGTVQIMIGVIIFLFGIVFAFNGPALGVFSGIFVWGASVYITSGSMTVATGRSVNRCLMNGTLAINVIAAVVALTGIILYSLDSVIWGSYGPPYGPPYEPSTVPFQGSAGILALLQFLELIISATTAGFACNATCYCCAEPSVSIRTIDGSLTQPIPTYQAAAATSAHFAPQMGIQYKNPGDPTAAGVPPAYVPN